MLITQRLLDTRARLSLDNKMLIPQPLKHRIYREALPKLWAATKQLLHAERKIRLDVRFGFLFDRVWFGIVFSLAADNCLGTIFNNRFILGIFPSDRKVIPGQSHPVTILFAKHFRRPTSSQGAALIIENGLMKFVEGLPTSTCSARHVVPQLHTQNSLLAAAFVSGIHTVKPRASEKSMHLA